MRAVPVLALLVAGCQTYAGGLQAICDAPTACPSCMEAAPDARTSKLSAHLDEVVRNGSARKALAALASADAPTKARILRAEAADAGIPSCALADMLEQDAAAAAPPTAPPDAAPTPAPPSGVRDRDAIQRVFRAATPVVRRCYERELAKDPSLRGRVTLAVTIAPDGAVTEALVHETTFAGPAVGDCLVERARELTFPPADAPSDVRYPFVFGVEPPDDDEPADPH